MRRVFFSYRIDRVLSALDVSEFVTACNEALIVQVEETEGLEE
jgi:hypothetical protein